MTQQRRAFRRRSSQPAPLTFDVVRAAGGWRRRGANAPAALAANVIEAVAAALELPPHPVHLSLVLSDDPLVRKLNRDWRGIDKPTNVLSFPAVAAAPPPAGAPQHLGDVVVAEETLKREAGELGVTFEDHYRHLVLHGLLHLLGYDHETVEEAEEMEALETRILASIGVADPYAGRPLFEAAPGPRGATRPMKHTVKRRR